MKLRHTLSVTLWSLLILLLGGAVVCAIALSQVNNKIKVFALAELQKRHPEFTFQIGFAELVEWKHILLKNVTVTSSNKSKFISIGEIDIECPVSSQALYNKDFKIERIEIKNPIISLTRSRSGHFTDWETLFSADTEAKGMTSLKEIEIANAVILYGDEAVAGEAVKLKLDTAKCVREKTQWTLQGVLQSEQLRRLTVNAVFDSVTKNWHAAAECRQLDWDNSLLQYIPNVPADFPRSFTGRLDSRIQASSDAQAELGFRFQSEGIFSQGYLDVPALNRTLTDLNVKFTADNSGFCINKLTASGEAGRIAVTYSQQGLLKRQSAELTANIRGLTVDERLAEVLSPFLNGKTQQILAKFDYNALADVHAELCYKNNRWEPKSVSLQVAELAFAYKNFPYKAERLSGSIYIDNKSGDNPAINFRFLSRPDDPLKVTVEGHYRNLTADVTGVTDIIAENVPIDDKLITSLPETTRQLANDLHPSGKLNAHLVFRLTPDEMPSAESSSAGLEKEFDIVLQNTSAKYEKFPYPVNNITGMLQFRNDIWTFEHVTASNGSASFQCSGSLHPDMFKLNVFAGNLPADEQLTAAVTETQKHQLLKSLHIQGNVDVNAQIVYQIGDRHLDLRFQSLPRAGLSLCPDKFPYRFQNVSGNFLYENGTLRCGLVETANGDVQMQTALDFCSDAAGQSVLTLSNLHVRQLTVGSELLAALPDNLRSIIVTTGLKEPTGISGNIRFVSGAKTDSQFDLTLFLHNNSVRFGFPADHITGRIRFTGGSADNQLHISGGLHLESLTVHQLPVTEMKGTFSYNNNRLQIGLPANRLKPDVPPQPVTADYFGGKLYGEGLVMFGDRISYSINSALYGADLALLAKQFSPASKRTAGTLNCTDINIQGIVPPANQQNAAPIAASGKIELRNADVYEAPAMLRLLRELGIREKDPNTGTFNSADINFKMSGNQVSFDPIIFEGNLLSIFGSGTMFLDSRRIDLMMKTRLGNRRTQIPLISGLIGGVGDQIMQWRIAGPADNPSVERVALPNLL